MRYFDTDARNIKPVSVHAFQPWTHLDVTWKSCAWEHKYMNRLDIKLYPAGSELSGTESLWCLIQPVCE